MDDACGCVCVDNDEVYTPIVDQMEVALRSHKCTECRRSIGAGEEHELSHRCHRHAGLLFRGTIGGGALETFRTCRDCLSVRREFFCDGWVFGGIWVDVEYHVEDLEGEVSSECLLRLTPVARFRVIDIIDSVFRGIDEEG